MKKRLIALLLILSFVLSFISCGEHIPAIDPDKGGDSTDDTPPKDEVSDPSTDLEGAFTVTVMYGGSVYIPEKVSDSSLALKVRLTDGTNYYTYDVGENGTVAISNLDGDYTVTLLNLPSGYTYNPNIYTVGNDNPNITVELLKIGRTPGKGTAPHNTNDGQGPKDIGSKLGVFRADFKNGKPTYEKDSTEVVYFAFKPTKSGSYCIESLVDISAEMFNPMIDIYAGNRYGYNQFLDRQDGGGASGSYTKNFKYILNVDEEYLGNEWIFGILIEGKDIVYPTYVDFSVSYLGVYQEDWATSTLIAPKSIPSTLNYFDLMTFSAIGSLDESLLTSDELNNATYAWYKNYNSYLDEDLKKFGNSNYTDAAIRIGGKRVFDEDYYKLNPDDGYYHVYDEEKYAEYGGWGPILYADITTACLFIADPFSTIEYSGNKALTVSEGTENYKMFIEGYYELTNSHGDSGPYFCNNTCKCYEKYSTARTAWSNALSAYTSAYIDGSANLSTYKQSLLAALENLKRTDGGLCSESCTDCNDTCRNVSDDFRFSLGYSNIARDGRCAVTQELKEFLQKYSESQRLFSDGNGWAEQYEPRYDAYEDSQWLFACGYYSD